MPRRLSKALLRGVEFRREKFVEREERQGEERQGAGLMGGGEGHGNHQQQGGDAKPRLDNGHGQGEVKSQARARRQFETP